MRSTYPQYYALIPALMALAIGGIRVVHGANNIFVNNIVPLISNHSASGAISSDSNQVPSATVATTEPPVPTPVGYVPIVAAQTEREYSVQELTRLLESKLKRIRNQELNVPAIQEIYDTKEFSSAIRNDVELLKEVSQKLSHKIEQAVTMIDELRRYILQTATKYGAKYNTLLNPCPYTDVVNPWEDETQFDLQSFIQNTKLTNVTLAKYAGAGEQPQSSGGFLDFSAFPASADSDKPRIRITDQLVDDNNLNLQKLFTDQSALAQQNSFTVKQQFFLSAFDQASAFKCHYYPRDGRLKSLFLSAVRNKHIVLLLDIGNSITFDQLEVAKAISKFMLYLLNESDRVSVVAVGQRIVTMDEYFGCRGRKFVRAAIDDKDRLIDFIDSLNRTRASTNLTAGFQYAFDAISEAYQRFDDEIPVVVLYLGRAKLAPSSLAARNVMRTIVEGQSRLPFPVIINSCLILLDEREFLYEKQFIADVTTQNFSKYNLTEVFYTPSPGKMVMIAKHSFDAQRFVIALMEPFLNEQRFIEDRVRVHLPYYDAATHETVVTVSHPVGVHGLVGIDLYLSDLAEHVAYYRQEENSYAFLIDFAGNTIMHPSFPRPLAARESFFVTNITKLEKDYFAPVYKRLMVEDDGNLRIKHYASNRSTAYLWKRTAHYIVCLVRTLDSDRAGSSFDSDVLYNSGQTQYFHSKTNVDYSFISSSGINPRSMLSELIYHRIDIYAAHLQRPTLMDQSGMETVQYAPLVCRLIKQLALADGSTLYLSSSSFQSPFAHIRNNREGANDEENVKTIQNIMAYLKDTYDTQLFANPGLLPEIRDDVLALLKVIYNYRKRHEESNLSKYIVRRYAATVNGVLQVFPGGLLDSDIEPTKRPWFVKAMEYPGKIVVTKPYLDAGGAGYIVSVSYTIFEGIADALHNIEKDRPIVVVSLDFTQGFFYKLLLESSNVCQSDNIKCFLMDDRGYLIAHPKLIEPPINNNRRTLEHITHKESQVANDILNHKQLVTKKMCYNYVNRTIQRFYQFNMSLTEVVTNLMYGEKTKYQITLIPGTNLFIGIVNSTNDGGAFCPCSTVGNSCLNCNRMEQTECECPCECPLDYDSPESCPSSRPRSSEPIVLCSPLPEDLISMNALNYESEYDLKSCTNINCEDYATQNECLGLVGCEWCQVDLEGENMLSPPFCTSQLTCFNGIFGSSTPYGDGAYTNNIMESILPPAYSAIGPVAGAILALCLVVGFAMYCYRQNADQNGASEQLYDDLVADHCNGLPLSRFDLEDNNPADDCDISRTNAKQNLLMNGQSNANYVMFPNVTSPYQMSSNYRRPNAGSSDHGYSTMTHHEESEHLCLSNADPVVPNTNGKRLSMSDSASINTSVSSPYSNHTTPNFLIKPPVDEEQQKFIDPSQTLLSSPTSISRTGVYGVNGANGGGHNILVPVTVHRNMEVS